MPTHDAPRRVLRHLPLPNTQLGVPEFQIREKFKPHMNPKTKKICKDNKQPTPK